MTKENFTSINVVIDASGSMEGLTNDTIGSFNAFLSEQKLVPGQAALTLCTFNTVHNLVHDFVELSTVPDLNPKTYRPNGGTALLDALGTTINNVGAKLAAMPEDDRPSKVIFLIITDGEENSSRTFKKEQVRAMVEHQRDVYKWEFVFMGANVDAFSEGVSLGISGNNTFSYTSDSAGTRALYNNISESMTSYRSSNSSQTDFFNQNNNAPAAPATPVTPSTPGSNQGNP
jgi:Uncharacterized protein encoded in toxicity protection region of plasmid R478, contains von Willebrand factor (vWF) domain